MILIIIIKHESSFKKEKNKFHDWLFFKYREAIKCNINNCHKGLIIIKMFHLPHVIVAVVVLMSKIDLNIKFYTEILCFLQNEPL